MSTNSRAGWPVSTFVALAASLIACGNKDLGSAHEDAHDAQVDADAPVQPILAATPPMGWNTWYGFSCTYDETSLRETADAMVSTGLLGLGYQYLIIDDCWQTSRDANGVIVADPTKFPSGIKSLADYVHARGLKLGIY